MSNLFTHFKEDPAQISNLNDPDLIRFIFEITPKNGAILHSILQVQFKNGRPSRCTTHNFTIEKDGWIKAMK